MISPAQSIQNLTLNLTQEIHVRAPMDVTFAALLEQIGPDGVEQGSFTMVDVSRGRAGGGTATWAMATAISGDMCKPSSGRRCSRSPDRCSCPTRLSRMCSTG